jgi:very-short-patch-repair endonuclease
MSVFTHNLDDLLYLSTQKVSIVHHLKKNYKENVHFIKKPKINEEKKHGGNNKDTYLLTEQAFEIFKNSYNLRNRYLVNTSGSITQINLAMCVENQTIGFIENSYKGIFNMIRQYPIGNYRVDLYFVDYNIAVECDENGHNDRDTFYEIARESYIKDKGNKMIRFNPNESKFDLSNVLREINSVLYS